MVAGGRHAPCFRHRSENTARNRRLFLREMLMSKSDSSFNLSHGRPGVSNV